MSLLYQEVYMSELLTILHDTRRYARTVIVYKRPVKSGDNFNRHSTRITSYLKQRHLVKKKTVQTIFLLFKYVKGKRLDVTM